MQNLSRRDMNSVFSMTFCA